MYDPRYSPAYQIPFQPLYQTTRLEIERSIFTLQEKFRRRKEIDLQLAPRPILPPTFGAEPYYQKMRLEQQERFINKMQEEANYQRQLAKQTDHLKRIEMLRMERDLLQRQNQYKRQVQYTPIVNYPQYDNNAQDDELIKKYQDGSKAKEYYKDLQLQSKRRNQQNQLYQQQRRKIEEQNSRHIQQNLQKRFNQTQNNPVQQPTNKKQIGAYSDRKDQLHNNKKQVYETPYDIIRQNQYSLKKQEAKRSPLVQQLQKQFDKIQQEKQRQYSPGKFANTMKEKDNTPLRLLEESNKNRATSPSKGMNKYQSMGKFAPYRSKSALSPLKKSYNESYLESRRIKNDEPKPSMKQIEVSALKKIQNRLKVSKVMYEDSQFRNIKYEQNHLYNTYEIECRQRKQIKDKVNSHPQVLKKHALVC